MKFKYSILLVLFFLMSCTFSKEAIRDKVIAKQGGDTLKIIVEVEVYINKKDIENAKKHLDQIEDKDQHEYIYLNSKIFLLQKDFEAALKEALKLPYEEVFNYTYLLGIIYDNLGNRDKSKEYIKKATILEPDTVSAQKYLEYLEDEHLNNERKQQYNIGYNKRLGKYE